MDEKNLLKSAKKYFAIIRLLVIDSLWRFRNMVFIIIVTGFLGVTFQAAVFVQLIKYINIIEAGKRISILSYTFEPRASIAFFAVFILGILVSLFFSSLLMFYSRTNTFKLGRLYEVYCSKRILSLLVDSPFEVYNAVGLVHFTDPVILKTVRTYAHYCGRVLRMLMDALIPLITVIFSLVVLVYYNFLLTIMLVLPAAIYLKYQYKANMAGVKNSGILEQSASGVGLETKSLLNKIKGTGFSLRDSVLLLDKHFETGLTKKYLDAYEGLLRSMEASVLISNILMAVSMFFVLVFMGGKAILKGEGWADILIYLLALRYGVANLRQLSKIMTSINRFYPQLLKYFEFINLFKEKTSLIKTVTTQENYEIYIENIFVPETLMHTTMHKGKILGLYNPLELNRFSIALLFNRLIGSNDNLNKALSSVRFIKTKYELASVTLKEALGFPDDYSWSDLINELRSAGLEEKLKIPEKFNKPISPITWENLDGDLKYALALLAAIKSDCQWLFLEEAGFRTFTDQTKNYFLNWLSNKITVFVYDKKIQTWGQNRENAIAFMNEKSIICLVNADWPSKNKVKVNELIASISNKASNNITEMIEIDSELDEY